MSDAPRLVHDAPALPALGDVLDFLRVIWSVDHELQRSSRLQEDTAGVTGAQRLVIRLVGRFPGIPAGHLAALLHVHPGTLTGILKRLERQGLVRRTPDPRDRRRALIGLTAKGRLLDIETRAPVEDAVQRVLARTSPEKIQAAREVLESIAVQLSRDRARDEDDALDEESA